MNTKPQREILLQLEAWAHIFAEVRHGEERLLLHRAGDLFGRMADEPIAEDMEGG